MIVLHTPTRERPDNCTYLDISVVSAISVSGANLYVETSTGQFYDARCTATEGEQLLSAFMTHIAQR